MGRLYPLFVDIEGRRVVVVGGGAVAQEKVSVLVECQAKVLVVSGEVSEELERWGSDGVIEVLRRGFKRQDVEGAWLVVVACESETVQRAVYEECVEKRIFCNVVDVTELCLFQVPAVCRRGDLQIAVSTGGVSPALASYIRSELEGEYDSSYEKLLEGLGELRTFLKERYPADEAKRSEVLRRFVRSEGLELIRAGKLEAFGRLVEEYKEY